MSELKEKNEPILKRRQSFLDTITLKLLTSSSQFDSEDERELKMEMKECEDVPVKGFLKQVDDFAKSSLGRLASVAVFMIGKSFIQKMEKAEETDDLKAQFKADLINEFRNDMINGK